LSDNPITRAKPARSILGEQARAAAGRGKARTGAVPAPYQVAVKTSRGFTLQRLDTEWVRRQTVLGLRCYVARNILWGYRILSIIWRNTIFLFIL